ncbi:MAG: molecular chaperone DnaJ [Coprobacillus sp.]|nr:molecular chaperone DnaJ [Coprobacillus sp.]
MAEKRDYYEVLGVSKSASKDEIKSAYRRLAKKYHPDNQQTGDEAKFKEVQEAYDILYDDNKRATYDQFGFAAFEQAGTNPGANPFNGGGGFGGFSNQDVDINDFFSSFFGGGMGGARTQRTQNGPMKGQDALSRVSIDFMDAVNGKDMTLSINVDEKCRSCGGTGAKSPSDIHTCGTCGGRGYVRSQRRSLFGVMESQEPCPNCGGTGKIITDKCPNCSGRGYVRSKVDQVLHIPVGINDGQQIKVAGKGERGINGGPNGDLYVEVSIKKHPYFSREGDDIHLDIPLDYADACLGCKIDVPTVYGDVTLTIPAGTQSGTILRMRGQGIKNLRTKKPGDQYVHVNIKTPASLNKEQKEALEKYKSATSENVYDKYKKTFKK